MGTRSELRFGGGRVVVVGGGVIGLSVAYHLSERGHTDVAVVERNALGSGTTSKGTGGVRQQFSSRINAELSRRAVGYLAGFADRVGERVAFRQHGYLFLIGHEDQLAAFEKNVAMQQSLGVPSRLLDPGEVPSVMPGVALDGLVGASYCPTDGSASAAEVAAAFARRARLQGTRFFEGTEVTGVERGADGAVRAVETTAGRLEAEVVVDAAGPGATKLGRMVGVELPITPRRRQAFEISRLPWLTPDLPLTVDLVSGAYVHPRPDGVVIGGNDRQVPAGFDEDVDWSLAAPLVGALRRRFPSLEGLEIRRGWAGLRDMTPDDHAILGPIEGVPGFWVAAGFSGHGFMHSPVVGELLSGWLLDGDPGTDVGPLRFGRFKAGATEAETTVF